jgi:hypothetical protein
LHVCCLFSIIHEKQLHHIAMCRTSLCGSAALICLAFSLVLCLVFAYNLAQCMATFGGLIALFYSPVIPAVEGNLQNFQHAPVFLNFRVLHHREPRCPKEDDRSPDLELDMDKL